MKHLFGPVPSRRLGMSLGIDLVPHKVCSMNCIYCECGATTNLTVDRDEYVPTKEVLDELFLYLEQNPMPDYLTFSGSGEPGLHKDLGFIIEEIKARYPDSKLALLTNGSFMDSEEFRASILQCDVILPSLDAASEKAFKKINRPHSGLSAQSVIEGLIAFRKKYSGKIWLEVFVSPGINDTTDEMVLLKEAIHAIKPDELHLNSLDRPGTVDWVKQADLAQLSAFAKAIDYPNTKLVSSVNPRRQIASYSVDKEDVILQTISRRPCTVSDLAEILDTHPNDINKYLNALSAENKIEAVRMERGIFYQSRR